MSSRLNDENEAYQDLQRIIEEQESLKAEFITSKFKLLKSKASIEVLAGVAYENCPSCGTHLVPKQEDESCNLCGSEPLGHEKLYQKSELIKEDLNRRVQDLEDSIKRHKNALKKQQKRLENIREEKQRLDQQLVEQLSLYESAFMARTTQIERTIAKQQEKIKNLTQIMDLPKSVSKLIREVDALDIKIKGLKRNIDELKETLKNADSKIRELEKLYLSVLVKVGVPNIHEGDIVQIQSSSWIPWIIPGDDRSAWNFDTIGSGGVCTLLNVCFALSLHVLTEKHGLPLPSFLIIDSPMKNIDDEVNEDLFVGFYSYLYSLIQEELADTQIIIIDNKYVPPMSPDIPIYERFLTKKKENPPLISYYDTED